MNNNELTKQTSNALDFSDKELLRTIKSTVAADATDAEFAMFIQLCKGTGLDPFKREVWFIKTQGYYSKALGRQVEGKAQIMAGINGFYAIANSHPEYDGMEETTIEREGKNIIRATAKVWRKDRRFPSVGVAEWDEYFPGTTEKGKSIWETKPSVMIAKVAESIALRKAFPNQLNGLYTQEEMPSDFKAPVNVTPKDPTAALVDSVTHPDIEEHEKSFLETLPYEGDPFSHVFKTKGGWEGKLPGDIEERDLEKAIKHPKAWKKLVKADKEALKAVGLELDLIPAHMRPVAEPLSEGGDFFDAIEG